MSGVVERAWQVATKLAELTRAPGECAEVAARALDLLRDAFSAEAGDLQLTGTFPVRVTRGPGTLVPTLNERYPSVCTVALIACGQELGALTLCSTAESAFPPPVVAQLEVLAAQLATLLAAARPSVPDSPPQYALELRALQRASEAVARSLDLDEVLGRCLDLAVEVAHAPAAAIYLRERERGIYHRVVARNVPDNVAVPEVPLGVLDGQLRHGNAQLVDLEHLTTPHPSVQAARAHRFRRLIMLPLRVEQRVVGMLALYFQELVVFQPSTVLTLEALGGQEAVAIENARAHRLAETRARLADALRRFGERAIAVAEDAPLNQLTLETALELMRADRGCIGRVFDGKTVRIVAGLGKDKELVGIEGPTDSPHLRQGLDSAEPFIVEDTAVIDPESQFGRIARQHGTVSFVLHSMRYRGRAIGLLFAGSGERRRWEPEEVEALHILGAMAGEALERARLRAQADAERRRLDDIIEQLPIVISVIGKDGKVLHLNEAGRAFSQYFYSTLSDEWHTMLPKVRSLDVHGQPIAADDLLIMRAFRGERPPPRELILESPDGTKRMTVMGVAAPLTNERGEIDAVVTGFQDVSKIRELADAKDRFLRVASHELRSPITSLRATTSLLELDPQAVTDPGRRAVMLQRIQRQVDRLVKLVEQLLDSARLNAAELPIEPTECDLTRIAREAIELATSNAPADRPRVQLEAPARLPGRWDPTRIEQVLTNLISNALRYSPTESPVRVRLRTVEERAVVEVEDAGIGIPEDQLARVFSPFFRGANAIKTYRGGLGLGLHITHEIVKRHGGTVRVVSRVGVGSTFTVELPLEK